MPNLRIVSDNALERAASFIASSRAGTLVEANLLNWKKSSLHRATGTGVAYTVTWAAPEPIGCVVLPFCNLSPTAQMRVRVSEEASAVNRATYSELLNNAAWTKSACTISTTSAAAASVTAPSGGVAHEIQEDATTAEHYAQQTIAVATLTLVTVSVLVRAAERSFAVVKFDATTNTAAPFASQASINLTTGALSNITAGGWTYNTPVNAGGGWWRVSATRTTTAAGNIAMRVMPATSATTFSYLGTAGNGIYAWGLMLEYGNLSSYYPNTGSGTATRPAGYIDTWQSYDYDSGLVLACPWPAAKLRGYTAAQAASAYAYGGGTYARHWLLAEIDARGLKVDIDDPDNLQGYIEAACMVAGPYWSPKYNAASAPLTPIDNSQNILTGGADTVGEVGFISKEIGIDLTSLTPDDRTTVMRMARNSSVYPILISVFPADPDPAKELDYMAYATPSKSTEIGIRHAAAYQTKITFKEV